MKKSSALPAKPGARLVALREGRGGGREVGKGGGYSSGSSSSSRSRWGSGGGTSSSSSSSSGQVGKSVPRLTFSKSHQSCVGTTPVLLSVGVVKTNQKETPLQKKGSEEPIGNAESEQLLNMFLVCIFCEWAKLCGVDRFLGRKPSGQICVVWIFLNSQKRNSSLQNRGAQKYLSGKRMQMQTKLFNNNVLVFFFLCGFSLST